MEHEIKMQVNTTPASVPSLSLQRAAVHQVPISNVPPIVHDVLRSPGQPLDSATRAFMEPRLGHDLSGVPTQTVSPSSVPARLAIGASHDRFEQEADRFAQLAMSRSSAPVDMRHDFSGVQIHTDAKAAESAQAVDANAYTVGNHIVFGAGQFAPRTNAGQRLLAHELSHVVQQAGSGGIRDGQSNEKRGLSSNPPVVQRQPKLGGPSQTIPTDLSSSADVARLSDEELAARHDRILEVLSGFTMSTPDTVPLENEVARIGAELGRRKALKAGRTFTKESIERMRDYFIKNAKKPAKPRKNPPPPPPGGWQDSCIVTLNNGMKIVTGEPTLPTTPETIEKTMAKVAASGHSSVAREVWFVGKSGRITRGGARPEKLQMSIWDTVVSLAGGDPGWSVFTMSLLDGNHSVTLTLDANDPSRRHMYWSDQWGTKGGWKEYTPSGLDAEVTRLTQKWWDEQKEGKKFNTVVRVWRVSATPAANTGP